MLILRPWNQKLHCGDECFTRAPLWIHVRGLPHQWTSREVGWKLGSLFPQCLNVIIPENGSASGKIIKLYAEVDLTKPLLRGTKLTLEEEMFWVEFKYESLPTLCFYYGILGHMKKSCDRKMTDSKEANLCEGQYGEWMRVQGRPLGRQEGRSEVRPGKQVDLGKEMVEVAQDQRQVSDRVGGTIELKDDIPVSKVSLGESCEFPHDMVVGSREREMKGVGHHVDLPGSEEGKQHQELGESKQDIVKEGGEVMELDGLSDAGLSVRSVDCQLDQS